MPSEAQLVVELLGLLSPEDRATYLKELQERAALSVGQRILTERLGVKNPTANPNGDKLPPAPPHKAKGKGKGSDDPQ